MLRDTDIYDDYSSLNYVDTNLTSVGGGTPVVFSFTGTGIGLLNTVPLGVTVNSRVGKRIKLDYLTCRGHVHNVNTVSTTYNHCTLLVVYDKRPAGSLPGVGSVYTDYYSFAFKNDDNSGRFIVLARKTFIVRGRPGAENQWIASVDVDFGLDLKGLPTVYKDSGVGDITDIEEGALYYIALGDNNVGNAAVSEFQFRVRFVDV